MDEEKYTLEEIRKAFWEVFHESGELWFPYKEVVADEKECQEVTEGHWEEFLEALKEASKHGNP